MIFLALPGLEILDLAGPLQAFSEANRSIQRFRLATVSTKDRVLTDQGVVLAELEPLPSEVGPESLVVVPGMPYLMTQKLERAAVRWLRRAHDNGAQIASVCTGSFVLGEAGLLEGRRATTHWSRIAELRQRFPRATVLDDRLFVSDGSIITSAGIASGIDMTLAILEGRYGPAVAAEVAREMVVYIRRDGAHRQSSIYLDFRTHLHPGVHRVQDWLLQNPSEKGSLEELGEIAAMSPRHLTRVFRQLTGISIKEYTTRVRLELAQSLLQNPSLSIDEAARRCGFADGRQLRRLWMERFGEAPSKRRRVDL